MEDVLLCFLCRVLGGRARVKKSMFRFCSSHPDGKGRPQEQQNVDARDSEPGVQRRVVARKERYRANARSLQASTYLVPQVRRTNNTGLSEGS